MCIYPTKKYKWIFFGMWYSEKCCYERSQYHNDCISRSCNEPKSTIDEALNICPFSSLSQLYVVHHLWYNLGINSFYCLCKMICIHNLHGCKKNKKKHVNERGPIHSLTFKRRSTTMQVKPKTASHTLVSVIFSNTAFHVSVKLTVELNLRPNKDLIWVVMVERAAAMVKPPITGIAINSTRKPKRGTKMEFRVYSCVDLTMLPKLRKPTKSEATPEKKARRTAAPGPIWTTASWVSRHRIEEGPMVIAFVLPSSMYTKLPTKAAYSPY